MISSERLNSFLIDEVEISPKKVAKMSKHQKLNAWLRYHGIVGYTYDIEDVIEQLIGKKLFND